MKQIEMGVRELTLFVLLCLGQAVVAESQRSAVAGSARGSALSFDGQKTFVKVNSSCDLSFPRSSTFSLAA